ncbi:cytochrome P450 [Globomyces pollinis-pini]|nr:cytochrome P450 [Globomyces pollinis-pini]
MLNYLAIGGVGFLTISYYFKNDAIGSPVFSDPSIKRPDGHVPIFGCILDLMKNFHRLHDYFSDQMNVPNVKALCFSIPFTPPFIIINDPQSIEHITSTNFDNYVKGQLHSSKLTEMFGNGIFNADGAHWNFQRKVGAKVFTTRAFKNTFDTVFADNIEILLDSLNQSARDGTQVDLHDLFHRFFLDSFGKIAFGIDLQGLSMAEVPFAVSFDRSQKAMVERYFNPLWKISEIFNTSNSKDIKLVRDFGLSVINDRRNNPKDTYNDLLALFMNYSDSDGNGLDDEVLVDQVINFIIAGRDTTAQALSWTFYHLAKNPRVVQRLQQEISEIVPASGANPTYDEVKKMKYANAVFKEALRLNPSVPCETKEAVDDDVLPNGTRIKRGESVVWLPYSVGRNNTIWENPHEFSPERWLTGKTYSQFEYPVFNSGPRICLGKTLAELQGVFVLTSILKRFNVNVVDTARVKYAMSITQPMEGGLICKVESRNQ